MKIVKELENRGFVHQFTGDSVNDLFGSEKRVVYHGIDPTADSAHAGNFVNWMLLYHLASAGHKIIFLVGGGTGRIGDPKPDGERVLKTYDEIDANVEKIKKQAQKIFGNLDVVFVNNHEWLKDIKLIEFLRDIGKHFTVNELLKKEAITKRVNSEVGISYTEFAYPLLQAYDYLELFKRYNCTVQVGGSDQWGNMVAGVDLIRRIKKTTAHVFTVPLVIDTITGKKFGKSEGNAIWLDATKTSPYQFFQFWYNVDDVNVEEYLKLFTTISLNEISDIMNIHIDSPEKRTAQSSLAMSVTSFVHGEEVARSVSLVASIIFGGRELDTLTPDEKELLINYAPISTIQNKSTIVDVIVESGLAQSKREARQFVQDGAVSVQYQKIDDVNFLCSSAELGHLIHVKRGKKNVSLVLLR
jgi:tyrosyl-tRNA synthetase